MVRVARLTILFSTLWLAASASATTYYISTSGSDSNAGTSQSAPWQHAPGMSGCSGNCASKTPAAGDQFILHGGDSWHYNSSKGVKGLPWVISGTGSSGSLIYFGVDKTWYTGGSWVRPILDGDNPLSTTAVSSCTTGGIANATMITVSTAYAMIDDLEVVGYCWNDNNPYLGDATFYFGDASTTTFRNIYVHGWTHTSSAGSQAIIWAAPAAGNKNITWDSVVVDGSDSDPTSEEIIYKPDAIHVKNSIFRYFSNFVPNSGATFINNLVEYSREPYDSAHGNAYEELNGHVNYIYNNVFRNNATAVNIWTCPGTGTTSYYFNNVVYSANSQNFWDVNSTGNTTDATCSSVGAVLAYNNTFSGPGNFGDTAHGGSFNGTLNSNYFLGITIPNPATGGIVNQIASSASSASSYGYTSANAFIPTTPDCNGNASNADCPVGKGTNFSSLCPTLNSLLLGAGDALCSDSTGGPRYSAVNHRVNGNARTPIARPSSGAWDAGAFQASTVANSGPAAPTGLAATVQ